MLKYGIEFKPLTHHRSDYNLQPYTFFPQMTDIFELYQSTFKKGIRKAQAGFASVLPDLDDIKSGLDEAEEELGKMSIQYSSTRNPQMKTKIDVYRKQLQNYKKDLDRQIDLSHTQQLFDGVDKNSLQGYSNIDKLQEAKKQMYENLEIEGQISQNLQNQTQGLQRARGKLDNINGYLSEAHGLVNSIRKKMMKNKLVMWVVAAIFIITFAIIIFSYI